jgi:HAD superfamily phosphoserine phosphatase-like hydrolase
MAAAARRTSAAALARLLPAARPCAAWVPTPARTMSAAVASAASTHPPARAAAMASLRSAHAVCFDVDSTVITVEAIDEFAAFAGKKAEVAELTAKAMGGSVLFQDALAARLSLINPTSDLLARFLREHPFEFTPGVRDVIGHLQRRGTSVYLVSGGFTQMINPVADVLGITRANVYANTILFAGCVAADVVVDVVGGIIGWRRGWGCGGGRPVNV